MKSLAKIPVNGDTGWKYIIFVLSHVELALLTCIKEKSLIY